MAENSREKDVIEESRESIETLHSIADDLMEHVARLKSEINRLEYDRRRDTEERTRGSHERDA